MHVCKGMSADACLWHVSASLYMHIPTPNVYISLHEYVDVTSFCPCICTCNRSLSDYQQVSLWLSRGVSLIINRSLSEYQQVSLWISTYIPAPHWDVLMYQYLHLTCIYLNTNMDMDKRSCICTNNMHCICTTACMTKEAAYAQTTCISLFQLSFPPSNTRAQTKLNLDSKSR